MPIATAVYTFVAMQGLSLNVKVYIDAMHVKGSHSVSLYLYGKVLHE